MIAPSIAGIQINEMIFLYDRIANIKPIIQAQTAFLLQLISFLKIFFLNKKSTILMTTTDGKISDKIDIKDKKYCIIFKQAKIIPIIPNPKIIDVNLNLFITTAIPSEEQ